MATPRPIDQLPLPVRIFHTAMQRQKPLDAYAAGLDTPAEALRALLTTQTDDLDAETLGRLAAAHGLSAEAGLSSLNEVTAAESFSAWLNRHMEGISQTSLRARTQLDGPQLRAFLSGKALPDADQAERIARALYVNSVEMARVIVADMASRAGWPARSAGRAPEAAAEGAPEEPAAGPRPRRRRQAADAADASPAPSEAAPEPSVLEEPAATEPAPRRRRRAPTDMAAAPPTKRAPQPADAPAEASAAPAEQPPPAQAEVAELATGRRRRGRTSDAPAEQPPPAQAEVAELAMGRRRGRTPAPEQQQSIDAPGAASTPAADQLLPAEASTAISAEEQAQPAPPRRRGRQPAAVAEAAPAAPSATTEDEPPQAVAPEARPASPPARGRASTPSLADAPGAPPSSGSPTGEDQSVRPPAAQAPRDAERPATAGRPGAEASTTAAIARPDEAMLLLSPDEVRLIRSWRRLHPHGQRATLQYIGSLLVEE